MSKKKLNFKNLASLDPVLKTINEANEAINDPSRTIEDSDIPEVLGGAIGAGAGAGLSFAALYGLGTMGLSAAGMTSGLATAGALVGGGMAAGVFVLAGPIAVFGVGGAILVSKHNKKKLAQAKGKILLDAIRARDGVIHSLKNEVKASKARLDELNGLNILLQSAIKQLREDVRRTV